MTCHHTIDWLLEAEPSELGCPQDQEVRAHLAFCGECRSRVSRIVGDTAWLARTVSATSTATLAPRTLTVVSSRVRRKWPSAVGAALAAASLLFVFAHRESRPEQDETAHVHAVAVQLVKRRAAAVNPAPIVSVKHSSPVRQASLPAPRSLSLKTATPAPVAYAVEAVAVTATFVPPTPARSVRLDTQITHSASPRIEPRSSFAIDAGPATGRYAVLQSTPKVTVVWFY